MSEYRFGCVGVSVGVGVGVGADVGVDSAYVT